MKFPLSIDVLKSLYGHIHLNAENCDPVCMFAIDKEIYSELSVEQQQLLKISSDHKVMLINDNERHYGTIVKTDDAEKLASSVFRNSDNSCLLMIDEYGRATFCGNEDVFHIEAYINVTLNINGMVVDVSCY
ncbi:hypothetical protein ACMXYR_02800 [Neptuniibacter sp. QD29_5]|uniref:hypothetical protein n=1 Tax=Neptuniibacter sp. QD29_5 TaxID=3398207 RepID=UPI0039F5F975